VQFVKYQTEGAQYPLRSKNRDDCSSLALYQYKLGATANTLRLRRLDDAHKPNQTFGKEGGLSALAPQTLIETNKETLIQTKHKATNTSHEPIV
jgi:hypothetical protein